MWSRGRCHACIVLTRRTVVLRMTGLSALLARRVLASARTLTLLLTPQVLMIRDQFHTLADVIVAGLRSPEGFNGVSCAPSSSISPRRSLTSLTLHLASLSILVRQSNLQTVAAPSPKSGLINGRGVYNCSAAPANSTCTQQSPIELHFPPNQRIRLRMINMGTHGGFSTLSMRLEV